MRRVVVDQWMSLDGVVQAPGTPDEDMSGGFRHGGWHLPYFDEASQSWVVNYLNEAGGFLLGRYTYETLAAYWPNASEQEQALARPLNSKPKYVVSATLDEPLAWENSSLVTGDVAPAVTELKRGIGGDLHVLGSPKLVGALMEHDLVDEFRLMIDPVVLGGGKRLFIDDGALRSLQLVEGQVTTTGAFLGTYEVVSRS
ncbi:MAG TPA: dihydrofolate reductase family protein [Actinomycetota bacterium]|nr:dihydrofolate reductase family protein [Actinomycetota bacterium]